MFSLYFWKLFSFVCALQLFYTQCNAFNFAKRPNYVIKTPDHLKFVKPKTRSSYFGFTLILRETSIIVGAPRAQSTLERQRNVIEPGAIYKCTLQTDSCYPYIFEDHGNRIIEQSEFLLESEKRDYQWLGAAMDGGIKDTDKLLVCAPRFIAPTMSDYHLHGICYWINDTLSEEPNKVTKISPLLLRAEQVTQDKGRWYYNYILGEQGLSAHVTDDNEQFLLGAPGIRTWKGSVIRYRREEFLDNPIASRRDTTSIERQIRDTDNVVHRTINKYKSDVLKPELWNQPDDSYFGYAVSSGYFDSEDRKKLLYIATAPQAAEQSGEAYLFDIRGSTIVKYYVFRGHQFGEYFGYSVLVEDLNGDGLSDVIISAPLYSFKDSHDNGAIYVFVNLGNFHFEVKVLKSPISEMARFGTTLARLGDINHDGYNDIAVGAPFANNGSVFIYLGDEKGIREQHSQRLNSPLTTPTKYGVHMFGHGLSKGSDIDKNGFNDLAVGAPNAEAVFLYRAYPVLKIIALVKPQTREISPGQSKVKVSACYSIETTSTAITQQDLAIRIVADPQVKRVKFSQTQNNELSFTASAGTRQQCRELDCDVQYSAADIFKPIEFEMHYNVVNQVPDSEVFCETCAAVDPADPKVFTEKIIFSTGCASDICVADLKLTNNDIRSDYILGSSKTLRINYEISNNGETAYLPQLNVTSSNRMSFAQIPSNCKLIENVAMLCDLNRGQPMAKGAKDSISVSFDVSSISGHSMTIIADVFSTGKELSPIDNTRRDVIALKKFTEVEATGAQTNEPIDLEHYKNTAEIINSYEVKSNGPSTVDALEVIYYMPVAFIVSDISVPIIDISNITMQAIYDGQLVGIDLIDANNTQILMETVQISTTRNNNAPNQAQTTSVERNTSETDEYANVPLVTRRRRNINRRELLATTAIKEQYMQISETRVASLYNEDFMGKLPINRTIVFNCRDNEMTTCVRAVIRVHNFKPDSPISIRMQYNIDLNEINEILSTQFEFFVILIDLSISHSGYDTDTNALVVASHIEPNVISKHRPNSTPFWILLLAILGGLLLLAIITYGMYKLGFFKRTKKEELDKLVQQNEN